MFALYRRLPAGMPPRWRRYYLSWRGLPVTRRLSDSCLEAESDFWDAAIFGLASLFGNKIALLTRLICYVIVGTFRRLVNEEVRLAV